MAHLISVSNLKKLSYISTNVDDTLISTIISRVQDTVIEPILGSSLYNHLLNAVDNNTLNVNEQELLSKYLSKCLIAAVEVRAVDMTTLELRQVGLSKVNAEGVNTVNESEMNRTINSLKKDYNFYRERLIRFLKLNYLNFPEYTTYYNSLYGFDENGCGELGSEIRPDNGGVDINISFV